LSSPVKINLNNQTFWLCSDRCIFWEKQKSLILSDLHLGKSGHFRKSGIAVPQNVYKEDLQRLFSLIQYFNPDKLLIVGDLFHSHANKEMELFAKWRKDLSYLPIQLIKGNHDILTKKFYSKSKITTTSGKLAIDDFCFTHDIMLSCKTDENKPVYTFSGHIHPGIKIKGAGKQSLYFPCFYFGETYTVLPAFSRFTGLSKMEIKPGDKIFAIVENQIIKIQ
jgi:DNA ligase-associated metallophosphoesterase